MRAVARGALLVAAAIVALAGIGSSYVAYSSNRSAHDALLGTLRLYAARLEVAEAQEELEGGNIDEALEHARLANATALRVGEVTGQIVALLEPTGNAAERTIAAGEKGARRTVAARRQTQIAADALGAIAGYQNAASRYAAATNRALRRILAALRKTNEEFPSP